MGLFTKFNIPFEFSKKTKALPQPINSTVGDLSVYKTIATFDLNVGTPRYEGDIPDATVKFYPLKVK